jgi:hypothetical protein
MNFLEELVGEWYEYNGFFVRKNIKFGGPAGKSRGGHMGEIDVAAFDPKTGTLIHIETSADAYTQEARQKRFVKKFSTAADHYKILFDFPIKEVKQIVIVGYSKNQKNFDWRLADNSRIEIKDIPSFILEICDRVGKIDPMAKAIPESLPLLRAIQHSAFYLNRRSRRSVK